MTTHLTDNYNLPPAPARIFCVGIGGIGVSALAQFLVHLGYSVAGSDRGLDDASKAHLYRRLQAQGIRLYPQDGTGVTTEQPQALVISNAVEPGNPDLAAAVAGTPVIHRARALAQALDRTGICQIAVAGSCGKTSVTGWIAAALRALGEPVLLINGGYDLDAESETRPGNFYADAQPRFAVVEVDESDKSLVQFTPHYGVLLNVGSDHYGEDELRQVFTTFLGRCRQGIVCMDQLACLANAVQVPVTTFAPQSADRVIAPSDYQASPAGISFDVPALGLRCHTTQSGRHSALNACAVLALLQLLRFPQAQEQMRLQEAIAAFRGVRQRFEQLGTCANGLPVINDYAHNPEKIAAALETARERFGSPLLAVFQPHGFSALRAFRSQLCQAFARVLTPEDTLVLLPVFYAGGSATFSPTSAEVVADLKQLGLRALALTRDEVAGLVDTSPRSSCLIIMGARDPSLRDWAALLATSTGN